MTNEQFGYTSTRGRDRIHMLRPRTEFGRRIPFRSKEHNYIISYHLLPVRLRPSLHLNISVFLMVYQLLSLVFVICDLVHCFCNFVFVIVICTYFVFVIVISIYFILFCSCNLCLFVVLIFVSMCLRTYM